MLDILRTRFFENRSLHPGLEWPDVEMRILADPQVLGVLQKMEESGGEPDTIGLDEETGKLILR